MPNCLYITDIREDKVVFERHPEATEPFGSASLLFQALRDALTSTLRKDSKEFWLIKFCSRVNNMPGLPLLHNPVSYQVLIDPLQVVRDPVKEVQINRRLELLFYPSKSYFYRRREDKSTRQVSSDSSYTLPLQ